MCFAMINMVFNQYYRCYTCIRDVHEKLGFVDYLGCKFKILADSVERFVGAVMGW
jgi:hypothetical protein